jgi:hypothetical protein
MDRQTLERASDGTPLREGEAARRPPLYLLRMVFVGVLARRVVVPGVRIEIVGRGGGICAAYARGGSGGLGRVLLVPS